MGWLRTYENAINFKKTNLMFTRFTRKGLQSTHATASLLIKNIQFT